VKYNKDAPSFDYSCQLIIFIKIFIQMNKGP